MGDGYRRGVVVDRRARRVLKTAVAGGLLALTVVGAPLVTLAQSVAFAGGGQIGGDRYEYAAAPYALPYEDAVYTYATGKDGKGYYAEYEGGEWSSWRGWEDQTAAYVWQPVAAAYGGAQHVFYDGADGSYYHNAYDGSDWSGWSAVGGDYQFPYAPYANEYDGKLYLYGAGDDGNLYYASYDGEGWGEWAAANDDYAAGAYQPYAVEWGGYNNLFWTGADGKVYWNRYNDEGWTGAKALPYADGEEYEYGASPYAVGYDDKLYAYAVAEDGRPYYSSFADGEGWSGWQEYDYEAPTKYEYQPSAYVYEGKQHLVYTGDDGHAYYASYDGSWSDWQDLGENYAYDPYQYEFDGKAYLTYTGEDGYAYYKEYGAKGGYEEPEEDDGY